MTRTALALCLLAILATGCSAGTPSASPTSPPASAGTRTATATASAPANAPTTPLDIGGTTILPGHTVVAYYGVPGTSIEGALGDRPADAEWSHVVAAAKPFGTAARPAVPAYELIADAESGDPQPNGSYITHLPAATIRSYLRVVHREHGLLILDIQPGREDFLPLAKKLSHWLADPDVSLGLDPEWKLYGHQVPDRQIGHVNAAVINGVSGWLDAFTVAHHLPQKLLVIHQFAAEEVRQPAQVTHRAHVDLVFNMDGHGPAAVKRTSYRLVATHKGFALGFKLFYKEDQQLFSARQVLHLHPRPQLVEYQ